MIPYGGTFVRPGVIAWDGVLASGAVPVSRPRYSSCDVIEQAIIGVRGTGILDEADAEGGGGDAGGEGGGDTGGDAGRLAELVAELSGARLWLPLPAGPKPVTDGSAIVLPVIRCAGTDFVPAFTSVQRLGTWGDPRTMRSEPGGPGAPVRSGDPAWVHDIASGTAIIRHVVVPFAGLARLLPETLGIAINPGSGGVSLRLCPDAVAMF
jgi:hypothetical protein